MTSSWILFLWPIVDWQGDVQKGRTCNKGPQLVWTRDILVHVRTPRAPRRIKCKIYLWVLQAPLHLWNKTIFSFIQYYSTSSWSQNLKKEIDHNTLQVWSNYHIIWFCQNKWKHNVLSLPIKLYLIIQCGELSFLNKPQVHWQILRRLVGAF